mmetsp:Transcript_39777/g.93171  ORF Transcript_39777/g.93171 Transcript_39777/m.93171 type:complete len:209 (-) Transcript_39777:315-941(-)
MFPSRRGTRKSGTGQGGRGAPRETATRRGGLRQPRRLLGIRPLAHAQQRGSRAQPPPRHARHALPGRLRRLGPRRRERHRGGVRRGHRPLPPDAPGDAAPDGGDPRVRHLHRAAAGVGERAGGELQHRGEHSGEHGGERVLSQGAVRGFDTAVSAGGHGGGEAAGVREHRLRSVQQHVRYFGGLPQPDRAGDGADFRRVSVSSQLETG